MTILVDTSVWSLALRRHRPDSADAQDLLRLLRMGHATLLGVVRQEVLSGIPDHQLFARLREQLRAVPDYPVITAHHERAAEIFNVCRSRGVQGSLADFLQCAVAELEDVPIYTTDQDFDRYAQHVKFRFYPPRS